MARRQRTSEPKRRRPLTHQETLDQLRTWLLPDERIFSAIRFHGNVKWTPTCLVWLALCWSWSEARHLTDAFAEAFRVAQQMVGCTLSTYQGFMGALVRWTGQMLPVLRDVVQRRMEQVGGKFWRIDGWVPIAFDGSRSTAPRTKSNEAAFCASAYGQGKTAKYRKRKSKGLRRKRKENPGQPPEPQAWITLLWHMGLRLPWSWRLGPSDSSEREHVMDMLRAESFPPRTLFCGDAGFVGYPLWAGLLQRHSDFLVRVGANVSLLHEHAHCVLPPKGKDRLVLCWPRRVLQSDQPPLRLRLLRVRVGKTWVWMLTSILEPEKLTYRAVARLYQLRWGVELEFRGLKQTLERGKLRCRNSQRLLAELDWSILALAVAELLALREQQAAGSKREQPVDPQKRSLAGTLRVLRYGLRNLNEVPESGQDLQSQLRGAVTDSYRRRRPKAARYRPANPDKKPLGDPKLRGLNKPEQRRLRQVEAKTAT
jgi:Transposase DDE domain